MGIESPGSQDLIVGDQPFGFTLDHVTPIKLSVIDNYYKTLAEMRDFTQKRGGKKLTPKQDLKQDELAIAVNTWTKRFKAFNRPEEEILEEAEAIYNRVRQLEELGTLPPQLLDQIDHDFPNTIALYPLLRGAETGWGYYLGQRLASRQATKREYR